MIGKWAELSVVRHQLRVLEMGDDQGDLVMISWMRYKAPSPSTTPKHGMAFKLTACLALGLLNLACKDKAEDSGVELEPEADPASYELGEAVECAAPSIV